VPILFPVLVRLTFVQDAYQVKRGGGESLEYMPFIFCRRILGYCARISGKDGFDIDLARVPDYADITNNETMAQ
jgi:hypothetical protein